jgi:branched-chain amino acid transport system ATP-binding protein
MLEVDNVEITYDDVILAVKGVSLRVPEGKIVTLLGANGAGKSTVLKAISGVLKSQEGKIESGKITYYQKPLNGVSPEKIVRMGISQVPEGRRVFQDLTCQENLRVGSFTRKNSIQVQEDMEKILGYFPALRKSLPVKAGYLSGGEQQMLAIGRALMSRPRFMLLDEPSLGLAPLLVK